MYSTLYVCVCTVYINVYLSIPFLIVQVLDHECKGHLTRDDLAKYLVEEGEPFSTEEIEEMMAAAVDPQKGVVYYRDYVQQLVEEQA